jgi:hypothetical protein
MSDLPDSLKRFKIFERAPLKEYAAFHQLAVATLPGV